MAQGMRPDQVARAREERLARASAELGRHLLGMFRPDLADFARGRAAGPRQVLKPAVPPRLGSDPNLYVFLDPDGNEVLATRTSLRRSYPQINPGSLSDLVLGKLRSAYGFRCLGIAEADPTD